MAHGEQSCHLFGKAKDLAKTGRKIVHLNIEGIGQNMPTIRHIISEGKDIAVFALAETKLRSTSDTGRDKTKFEIEGYKCLRYDNKIRKGSGGQIIYVDDSYKCTELSTEVTMPSQFHGWVECNIIQIEKQFKCVVCIFYVNPNITDDSTNRNLFLRYFENILQRLKRTGSRVVVMGDFNIDLSDHNATKARDTLKVADACGFTQLEKCYTRPASGTLLDHIYISNEHYNGSKKCYFTDRIDPNVVFGKKEYVSDHLLSYISYSSKGFSFYRHSKLKN